MKITTVGLDLAKNVFQVHGITADGEVVIRRRLRRTEVREFFAGLEPCLIDMEARGTSHFRARGRERGASRQPAAVDCGVVVPLVDQALQGLSVPASISASSSLCATRS